ncbi:MAG: ABC transporter permease [candidate division WOR-3 bacterium]
MSGLITSINELLIGIPFQHLFSGSLILLTIILLGLQRTGLMKDVLFGAVRGLLQLLLMGIILTYAFKVQNLLWQACFLLAMGLFAAQTAHGRLKDLPGSFWLAYLSVMTGTMFALVPLILMGIIKPVPQETIPAGGMAIGNALNAVVLALERFGSDVSSQWERAEAAFALGATPGQVAALFRKQSFSAGTLSMRNNMKIVGIIQIPGTMVGMILAGASPMRAALMQLAILYMLMFAISVSVSVALAMGARGYMMPRPQTIQSP